MLFQWCVSMNAVGLRNFYGITANDIRNNDVILELHLGETLILNERSWKIAHMETPLARRPPENHVHGNVD